MAATVYVPIIMILLLLRTRILSNVSSRQDKTRKRMPMTRRPDTTRHDTNNSLDLRPRHQINDDSDRQQDHCDHDRDRGTAATPPRNGSTLLVNSNLMLRLRTHTRTRTIMNDDGQHDESRPRITVSSSSSSYIP